MPSGTAPAPAPAEPQTIEVTAPKATPTVPPVVATAPLLTMAAIESLTGTPGYGVNEAATQYAEQTGMDPTKVGSNAYPLVPPWIEKLGTAAVNAFQKNPLGFLAAGASLLGGDASGGSGGIGGGANIPVNMGMTARRTMLPQPEYVPYSGQAVMGRQFFSPMTYSSAPATTPVTPEPIMEVGPANTGGGLAAGGFIDLKDGGFVLPADVVAHFGNGSSAAGLEFAKNNLGAIPINGHGDGMSDSIRTTIEGRQPAAVAREEAYISPEKVAKIGDGDIEKGSERLYAMMDAIRKARTGTTKQGKQINPEKFMPGGIASLATGGAVAFEVGGGVGVGDLGTTQSSTLSPWAAPYVTNMLSQAQAVGNEPYQAYTGPLSAGVSPLQQTAFTNAGNLGGTFDTAAAQQYMNPYIQTALNPQLDLLRRQADISLQGDLSKYTQAGAFGGSRSAIATGLNREVLGQQMERVAGQGYKDAFDQSRQQFNTQQQQNIANVNAQASLGGQQRDVEQQGITALQKQFEQERGYPQQQLAFQGSLLRGLPISTVSSTPMTSGIGSVLSDLSGAASIYKLIGDLFPS
jgi:hypothetical protein